MEIVLIVLIIFGISLLLSIYQLVRLGPSLRAAGSVVISAILFVLVLLVYLDMMDFRDKFDDSDMLLLLQDGEQQFIAGFSGQLKEGSVPSFLNAGSLAKKQVEYDAKDMDAFVGSNYKVFVLQPSIFEPITMDIEYGDTSFTPAEFQDILNSDQPASLFAEAYLTKSGMDPEDVNLKSQFITNLREHAEDDAATRGFILAQLISVGFKERGLTFLVRAISSGDVDVFKDTALYVFIRYTPPFLLEQVAQFEETNESTGQS